MAGRVLRLGRKAEVDKRQSGIGEWEREIKVEREIESGGGGVGGLDEEDE